MQRGRTMSLRPIALLRPLPPFGFPVRAMSLLRTGVARLPNATPANNSPKELDQVLLTRPNQPRASGAALSRAGRVRFPSASAEIARCRLD
jgi:hypothetical protein